METTHKPYAGMRVLESDHHANEQMECHTCHVAWPCRIVIEARREARDTQQVVLARRVYVPRPRPLISPEERARKRAQRRAYQTRWARQQRLRQATA